MSFTYLYVIVYKTTDLKIYHQGFLKYKEVNSSVTSPAVSHEHYTASELDNPTGL